MKQAGCLVSFSREFNVLVRFFVSGVTWSVRASSGKLCCVTSPGKLSSPLLCSRWIRCSVMLRLWHGLGLLQMVGSRGERPADRRALEGAVAKAGSIASRSSREFRDSRDVQEGKRESAPTGTSFLTVRFLDIAHRWLVQSERRYGAEPRPCPSFLGLMSTWSNISFIPWKIQTYRLYICLVTHDAKV